MPKTRIDDIVNLMQRKSVAKQQAFRATADTLSEIKKVLAGYEENLSGRLKGLHENLPVKFRDISEYECQLEFAGDTLVFMMHTNIFDFHNEHPLHRTRYVKTDPLREFCGMIMVYNFLSDTMRYKRDTDAGFLVARIFVNRERHFYCDGNKPFSLLFGDFEHLVMQEKYINQILEEAMVFCLEFDLIAPPPELSAIITLEQKNTFALSTGQPTVKRLGFSISNTADK